MKISVKLTRAENTALLGAGPVELDLEEYLCGVVPSEIYESSHMEALKAQAVAARTFAVKRAMAGTVVDDTTSFQAYRAPLAESSPRSRLAVEETAGQVLTYGGEVIDCFYSASNGGTCKRSGEVWSRDYPYYVNKPDPWDTAARTEKPTNPSHGVGLSQVGCMWAAKQGVPYNEILAFYYSGAALVHEYGTGSVVGFEEETGGFAMNLHTLIFTNNACYKAGRKITPKGIMVHSTGANNPWLKRYVGPDDGLLGKNQYNNHWNQPMDREVCVHAFIGKLADGTVATYQTLPWDHRGWHCGSGSKGSGNNTHISFEICEDGLTDSAYFNKVYNEAVELCAYLCKQYGLTEKNIICHSEGHAQGIASNHGDVMHWFPKHGKNMDTFRAAVKAKLAGSSSGNTGGSAGNGTLYRVRKSGAMLPPSSEPLRFWIMPKSWRTRIPAMRSLTKLGRRFTPPPLAAPAAAPFIGCARVGRMQLLRRALSMCWTTQNAVPTKIPVTLFLTRPERLYMRAAQPLLLTRCRRATACGPLQKSASETAPGTMRSRN